MLGVKFQKVIHLKEHGRDSNYFFSKIDVDDLKKLLHDFLLSLLNDLIIKLILKKIFVRSPLLILL